MRHKPGQPKRKQPITSHQNAQIAHTVSSKITQSTIASFHTLLKRQSILKKQLEKPSSAKAAASTQALLTRVENDMKLLGGLEAYQRASKLGQSKERGGDSSPVLIKWLKELGRQQEVRLRMLEIGALTPDNYASCSSWIDNYPIDLHAQHPDIVEQDFFHRPLPASDAEAFDIVSCSLVLNFVSSPRDRGRMLRLIHEQLRQSIDSLLFLVLPLPCIVNSRYISDQSLVDLMRIVGFQLVKKQYRPNGRVGYWLWRWAEPCPADERPGERRWDKKVVEQDGPGRNNFAIVLE